MKTSKKGIIKIVAHEGVVLGPYLDSVNVWTYGVGHTSAAGGPTPSTMPKIDTRAWPEGRVREEVVRALDLFTADLKKYEDRVNKAITRPLKQHQFDALVSFDFNTGGIYRAQLTKDINSGDMSGVGFMGWLKPKEIMGRRKAEQALFLTGKYDEGKVLIPVYDATSSGKHKFRMNVRDYEVVGMLQQTPSYTPSPLPNVNTNSKSIVSIILDWLKTFIKQP